jgi:hypothetical protein
MTNDLMTRVRDKSVTVDGLSLRYIEEGEGPAVRGNDGHQSY